MRQNNVPGLMLLSLIVAGCNKSLEIPKLVSIDPAFQSLVNDFVQESIAQERPVVIDNLSIHWTTELPDETLGECLTYDHGTNGTPTILINEQQWSYETATRQKMVIYHEMGHCVLWREHNEAFLPYGGVSSIMYPYFQADDVYLNNWAYYMQELFYGN